MLRKLLATALTFIVVAFTPAFGQTSPQLQIIDGGTGAATAPAARVNLGAAASGINGDILSITGMTTPLPITEGGSGATSAAAARVNLGAAASGINGDILSITGMTTPLPITEGGTGSKIGVSPLGSLTFTPSEIVNPLDPKWAGGADPKGIADSSPALSAALSVPASGVTIGLPGTGYTVGNLLVADVATNSALICAVYPVAQVSAASSGAITAVTLVTPGMCANTTAAPTPASSSPTPTYFKVTGGTGAGATLNFTWAARNAKVQFPCGNFLFNASVGAIHDNTEIAGNGDCTNITLSSTLTSNPNWAGNFGSAGTPPALLTNADFTNGNVNIHLHDFKTDSTTVLGTTSLAATFVRGKNIKVDHVHFSGPTPASRADNAGALFLIQSDQFWIDNNIFEGFLNPVGLWQGSTNWWITNNLFDGKGFGWNAMANNGLGSAQVYPPISNTSAFGYISKNIIRGYRVGGLNLLGLCSLKTMTCGYMNDITVSENRIDNIDSYHGIYIGGGARYKIIDNVISNVGSSCILLQSNWPGTVTTDSEIKGNTCYNANKKQTLQSATSVAPGTGYADVGSLTVLGGNCYIQPTLSYTATAGMILGNTVIDIGSCITLPTNPVSVSDPVSSGTGATFNLTFAYSATNSPIYVSATNGIVKNTTVTDNNVTGGNYQYATRVATSNFQTVISATPVAGSGVNLVGDILTAVGGTYSAGSISAATFTVSSIDGSNNITGVIPRYNASYNTLPANPVSVTSSGAGTGITLNITWQAEGAFNTSFRPGVEDAGTSGTDLVGGTTSPVASYGTQTFNALATFGGGGTPIALSIANPIASASSQMNFIPAGGTHTYQLGVGNASEATIGVAECAFLLDQAGTNLRWRVCADGRFNINPIFGVPAVAKLDVNGSARVAPQTLALAGTCNAAGEGMFARITDSTTSAPLAIIIGGGALHVFGICDGTNWTVH